MAAVIPSKNTTRALLLKGDWNASDRNRFSLRHSRTMKEDQNCSGQGGDGCNSSPLWTAEKRATFNGPIWSVLGTWTSTLSGTAFNEMRAYYGVNKIRITSNLAGTSGIDLLEQNASTGQFTERTYPGASFGASTTGGLEGETNLLHQRLAAHASSGKHQLKVGGQLVAGEVPDGHRRVAEGPLGLPGRPRLRPSRSQQPPRHLQRGDRHGDPRRSEVELRALRAGHLAGPRRPDAEPRTALRRGQHDHRRQRSGGCAQRALRRQSRHRAARKGRTRTSTTWRRGLASCGCPTDDRKLVIRGSAGLFYDQNHFNYNDVYVNQTLLANRRVNFNCNSTTDNPLYNAAEGLPASRVRCRAFLAERFPLFPNVASLGLIPELVVTLAPDFRVPYTSAGDGRLLTPAARATSRSRPTTSTRTATTCSCSATSISTSSTGSG